MDFFVTLFFYSLKTVWARHDIAEILPMLALNTNQSINQSINQQFGNIRTLTPRVY
jgi:hypothetical protein